MSAASDSWVADAKAVRIEDEIARRGIRGLKRSGNELVGPCPVCGGRDRFAVNLRKGLFLCRQSGAQGDVIELVEYLDGCDFLTACETLTGRPPPRGEGQGIDPDALARREAARQEAEAARERAEIDYRETERRRLWRYWQDARPIEAGGIVARYLAGRGLALPTGAALREHGAMPFFVQDGTRAREIHRGPAMLGAVVDGEGRFRGLHITWVDATSAAKAEIVDPETGEIQKPRKSRGSIKGCHIRLSRSEHPPTRLIMGEGNETTLQVRFALEAEFGPAFSAETVYWSGISMGNIGGKHDGTVAHPTLTRTDKRGRVYPLRVPNDVPKEESGVRALMPPPGVTEVILLGDGDSDRFTTALHLRRAANRWGRDIRTLCAWAPDDADFNSMQFLKVPA